MKISVLICNYNHGRFIEQTLHAILRQTHRDIEVILIDDASTDDSLQRIAPIQSQDSRISLYRNTHNLGLLKTFEMGMDLCKGVLWMGCGADDFLLDSGFFERSMNAMLHNPGACGVYGLARRIDSDTGEIMSDLGLGEKDGLIPCEEFTRGFFAHKYFVPGFSVMWRRDMLVDVGGFAMDLGPQFDYWVNHALPSKHPIIFFNEIVSKVRVFKDGRNFSTVADAMLKLQRHAEFEKRLVKLTGFSDSALVAQWRTQLIYDLSEGRNLEECWKIYMEQLLK